jgi:glucose/arabinose dehydrogenase
MRSGIALAVLLSACGNKPQAVPEAGAEAGPPPADAPAPECVLTHGTNVTLRRIGAVVGNAVLATGAPNDPRLFVIEQNGRIRIFDHEVLLDAPFLDLTEQTPSCNTLAETACTARVDCLAVHTTVGAFDSCQGLVAGGSGGEQGLLGLAFHPDYATNHQLYVFLTTPNPVSGGDPFANVLLRFTATGNAADGASKTTMLAIDDFANNHNAGMIEFGADGDLYISTGDGGAGGDPHRNAQNTSSLLGKILRIDVDHPGAGTAYSVPADNPFGNEVFMLGLRNPWRWSFDRGTGDIWIGDVGQLQTEELDYAPVGQQAGKNFGWSVYEGSSCCATQSDNCQQQAPFQACDPTGIQFPQIEKTHAEGWNAVIGGQVYRGSCYPDLVGTYFYTDDAHDAIATATVNPDGSLTTVDLPFKAPIGPASLHADAAGELYETLINTGEVYHLEVSP